MLQGRESKPGKETATNQSAFVEQLQSKDIGYGTLHTCFSQQEPAHVGPATLFP